jgi:hypothetical protein
MRDLDVVRPAEALGAAQMLAEPRHVRVPEMNAVPAIHSLHVYDALIGTMEGALDVQICIGSGDV